MKIFFRIIYLIFFFLVGLIVFFHPAKTETNILNAVFSQNSADRTIVELSSRYSSNINVIVESEDVNKTLKAAEVFSNSIDRNIFTVREFDPEKFIDKYKTYHNSVLSQKTILKLEKEQYEDVTASALDNLYNPLSLQLLPLNEDPFMLFTDYIKSLGGNSEDYSNLSYNEKEYSIIPLEIRTDYALSPTVVNIEIKKLINLQKNLSKNGVKIYLTGAPVHSYYASSRSMVEINIICILSAIFLFSLFKFYFSNIKLIIPAAISLGIGILSGYLAAAIVFPSIHVLTFVFSTTLIGICIDYSLHYFIERDLSKILKSLTVSMVTTVSAFTVLLFSGVQLLREIAVFTIAGLLSVYCLVVLFYPLLKIEASEKNISFQILHKNILLYTLIFLTFCGLFFVKFNDDIRNMYVPSKKLIAAEKLFKEITNTPEHTAFAIVKGYDFQDMLEKEEILTRKIADTEFQALSKFIPSHKQQLENRELIKNLYEHSLKNYASFLTDNEIKNLLRREIKEEFLDYGENDFISNFLIDKNTSLVVLYDFDNPEIIKENGAVYIDVSESISDKIKHCRKQCLYMLIPVVLLLFILLSFIYRSKTAAKILMPSIIAPAFAIGVLSLFHVEINLFHILAIFLIIGFGLDYSIFRAGGMKGSNNAVLLSATTTIFSFLLLSFTSFKLISSLGIILSIGLTVSYLTSIVFDYKEKDVL